MVAFIAPRKKHAEVFYLMYVRKCCGESKSIAFHPLHQIIFAVSDTPMVCSVGASNHF